MDFAVDSEKIQVLLVEPVSATVAGARQKLEESGLLQLINSGTAFEAAAVARKLGSCVVLLYAKEEEDIVKQVAMLKLLREQIMSREIRVIVTTPIRHAQVHDKYSQYGTTEIILEPLPERSLLFKLDRHFKAIQRERAAKAAQPAKKEKAKEKKAEESAGAESERKAAARRTAEPAQQKQAEAQAGVRLKAMAPLTLESDCFLVLRTPPKRVAGRWVVKLAGPGPNAGRWQEFETESESERCWKWIPVNPDDDVFIKEQGEWVFKGNRPELVDDLWNFVSRRPELSFYYEGEAYGSKISNEEHGMVLKVAADSKIALAKLDAIRASLHKVIRSDAEAEEAAEQKGLKKSEQVAEEGPEDQVFDLSTETREIQDKRGADEIREQSGGPDARMADPLGIESDFWLIEGRSARWLSGKWLVKLLGPGPSVGTWQQAGPGAWSWAPRDAENDPFLKEQGAWIFRGEKPEFIEGLWYFRGPKLRLCFEYEGESYGEKLRVVEGGVLEIAADSEAAVAMLEQIRATMAANVDLSSEEHESAGAADYVDSQERPEGGAADYVDEADAAADWSSDLGSESEAASGRRKKSRAKNEDGELDTRDAYSGSAGVEEGVIGGAKPKRKKGASEAEATLLDSGPRKKRRQKRDDDTEPAAGAVEPPELEVVGEAAAQASAAKRRREREALDSDASAAESPQKRGGFGSSLKEKLEKLGKTLSPEAAQALDSMERGLERMNEPRRARATKSESDAAGPAALHATSAAEPSLSPVAIAFLMSELMCRRGLDRARMASRYCAYLSSACAGARVELWARQEKDGQVSWSCAGSSDGKPGEFLEKAGAAQAGKALRSEEALVVGVASPRDPRRAPVGAVVLSGGVAEIQDHYAIDAGRMAAGLLQSLSDDEIKAA